MYDDSSARLQLTHTWGPVTVPASRDTVSGHHQRFTTRQHRYPVAVTERPVIACSLLSAGQLGSRGRMPGSVPTNGKPPPLPPVHVQGRPSPAHTRQQAGLVAWREELLPKNPIPRVPPRRPAFSFSHTPLPPVCGRSAFPKRQSPPTPRLFCLGQAQPAGRMRGAGGLWGRN
jgi:hypothetical protein